MRRAWKIHYNPLEDDSYGDYVQKKKQKLDVNKNTNNTVRLSYSQCSIRFKKRLCTYFYLRN